ncbi:MAG: hypothetical protein CM1200mP10_04220 [Candidatus Neomarinimicrobiota bacterium]|nr:MAG: hypothetical protein CM1200mP10_04220 [Candidatus Neomarinimicrobiota bacterium]
MAKYYFIFIVIIFFNCTKPKKIKALNLKYNNSLIIKGETHFNNIAQLTFSGENAEAYFSPEVKN